MKKTVSMTVGIGSGVTAQRMMLMPGKSFVRCATLEDADSIQEIYAPYVVDSAISFEGEPPTVQEMEARMTAILPKYPWLVFENELGLLGYAYACQHRTREAYRWSVDVAIYVKQGHGRSGIGMSLYKVLLPKLASMGFANAFAGITLPNAGSVALHESMGFNPIGIYRKVGFKMGLWHDVGWWQYSFDHKIPPLEPRGP